MVKQVLRAIVWLYYYIRAYQQYGTIDKFEVQNIVMMLLTQGLASNIVFTYISKIKTQTA